MSLDRPREVLLNDAQNTKAGPILDAEIREMAGLFGDDWEPSTEFNDAMDVVEKLWPAWEFTLDRGFARHGLWSATFNNGGFSVEAYGDTPSHAICLAYLAIKHSQVLWPEGA